MLKISAVYLIGNPKSVTCWHPYLRILFPFMLFVAILSYKCFIWARPKIWMHLVPLQKLLCRHKKQFYWMQIIFLSGTKCLWLTQYVNKFLVWHKKFGPNLVWTCKRTRHYNSSWFFCVKTCGVLVQIIWGSLTNSI